MKNSSSSLPSLPPSLSFASLTSLISSLWPLSSVFSVSLSFPSFSPSLSLSLSSELSIEFSFNNPSISSFRSPLSSTSGSSLKYSSKILLNGRILLIASSIESSMTFEILWAFLDILDCDMRPPLFSNNPGR